MAPAAPPTPPNVRQRNVLETERERKREREIESNSNIPIFPIIED